jgi:hypothetical protein
VAKRQRHRLSRGQRVDDGRCRRDGEEGEEEELEMKGRGRSRSRSDDGRQRRGAAMGDKC